jgi:hypothetical protein
MAIYMVYNIHIQYIFFNSPSELTFWAALVPLNPPFLKNVINTPTLSGACDSVVVEALRYKPEGRRFDS